MLNSCEIKPEKIGWYVTYPREPVKETAEFRYWDGTYWGGHWQDRWCRLHSWVDERFDQIPRYLDGVYMSDWGVCQRRMRMWLWPTQPTEVVYDAFACLTHPHKIRLRVPVQDGWWMIHSYLAERRDGVWTHALNGAMTQEQVEQLPGYDKAQYLGEIR